ncbi:MAG: class IV adenylate cyclase [Planctomycetota bacterium]
MPIEIEQKYRVANHGGIAERLAALGAARGSAVRQVDAYFAHPTRDFAVTDEALRLRRVGESNAVTYKGPRLDSATKTRREIELPLAEGDQSHGAWTELLEALGFRPVLEVAKTRTPYHLSCDGFALEIALDSVDRLGMFVEVEAVADSEQVDAARDTVLAFAGRLGLVDAEQRSYLELLLAAR